MMKAKRTGMMLLILLSIVLLFTVLYYSMSFSQNLVVKRTIFLEGHPIGAFTSSIPDKPYSKDEKDRICYVIEDPDISDGTENSVPRVCMKKNKFGMYYDIAVGAF